MKKFLTYFKGYKKEAFLAPLLKMLEALFELLVPFIIKDIIDNIIPSKNMKQLILSIVILFIFSIFGFLSTFTAQYFSAKVAVNVTKNIKIDIFKHIETLSYQDIDNITEPELITKMTSDANLMQNGINMFLRLFLRSPFVVFGALVLALIVNIKLGLIFAVSIPVLFLLVGFIIFKSIPWYKSLQEKLSGKLKTTKNNVEGIRVIRSFNAQDNEMNEFRTKAQGYQKEQFNIAKFYSILTPVTYVIINLSIIAIFYFGAKLFNKGFILKGDIVAEYNYMGQILIEIIKLTNLTITLSKALSSIKRIFEFLDIKQSQEFVSESQLMKNQTNEMIKFKNVDFKYQSALNNTLSGLNFCIHKGEMIGIIGKTASGKSTLINLINRSYDTSYGIVEIDGNDIKNYAKDDIHDKVLIVSKHHFFFKGTIKDNITLNKEVDDSMIQRALELSSSSEIVSRKGGLEGLINEAGTNLSGGEKERLEIARAILLNPDVLVFDAAMEALDNITEKEVLNNLKKLNKTIIIASDRINKMKYCDRIIVIEDGQITGFDTYNNLLSKNQEFKEINKLSLREDA